MKSLWEALGRTNEGIAATLLARAASAPLEALARGTSLSGALEALRGRSVLIATKEQLSAALALVELDGVARRLVLCTPDLTLEQLNEVAVTAEADSVVHDVGHAPAMPDAIARYPVSPRLQGLACDRRRSEDTAWVLLTSGTTGSPKLVSHTLESLAGALPGATAGTRPVWSTFYDIRRYGGLQIFLRAVLGGCALVLSSAGEPVGEFLRRAAAAGVTHISGTPSHWRRALMSGDARLIHPEYVRLSGEVADQTILDQLRVAYPQARIAHAFASTEAGVAFDVNDGLAGFPAALIEAPGAIEMRVEDGTLRIRSGRIADHYLGTAPALSGDGGFVDTGDLLERIGDRYHFRGRKGGVINVGGLKVYPEEVEAVLNADPRVQMSLVKGRRNPITGAVIVAEVVLDRAVAPDEPSREHLKSELIESCRRSLAAHKVPALLRIVPALELNAAGKIVRPHA